jgi:radical SAM protein with 4Fe4S-binding SPASM domain
MGIEYTVMPENIHVMEKFCEETQRQGFDWIIFNLCWFISKKQAADYEIFMQDKFNIRPVGHMGYPSEYPVNRDEFVRQFNRICSRRWAIQILWQPPVKDPALINQYIDSPDKPLTNRFCYKQWMRCDIMPDGNVVACKEYPDVIAGNLMDNTLSDIWNSSAYSRFRNVIRNELSPVCAKCGALGWYDAKR